ncbi:hypothetical protein GCM10010253_41260 [Streptomyces badius]|uniref:Uncharacterized protein n=1 Tax=Streptomyces badius TaxID=1941 RepID=A0ABQ2TBK3_STRBA|nr:hypothetical protein GCM10010253_41260 [Streptomyces badius]
MTIRPSGLRRAALTGTLALRRGGAQVGSEVREERRCWGGQLTGQMALDMRPRSTWRRLTKAIPVPDMTEACHGHLGAVHQYPLCGRLGLEEWDGVAPVTACGLGIADKSLAQDPKRGCEEGAVAPPPPREH